MLRETKDNRLLISSDDISTFDKAIERARNRMLKRCNELSRKNTVASQKEADIVYDNFVEDEQDFRSTLSKYRAGEDLEAAKKVNPWRDYNPYNSYT